MTKVWNELQPNDRVYYEAAGPRGLKGYGTVYGMWPIQLATGEVVNVYGITREEDDGGILLGDGEIKETFRGNSIAWEDKGK